MRPTGRPEEETGHDKGQEGAHGNGQDGEARHYGTRHAGHSHERQRAQLQGEQLSRGSALRQGGMRHQLPRHFHRRVPHRARHLRLRGETHWQLLAKGGALRQDTAQGLREVFRQQADHIRARRLGVHRAKRAAEALEALRHEIAERIRSGASQGRHSSLGRDNAIPGADAAHQHKPHHLAETHRGRQIREAGQVHHSLAGASATHAGRRQVAAQRHRPNHHADGRENAAKVGSVPAERREAHQRPPQRGGIFLQGTKLQADNRRATAQGRRLGTHNIKGGRGQGDATRGGAAEDGIAGHTTHKVGLPLRQQRQPETPRRADEPLREPARQDREGDTARPATARVERRRDCRGIQPATRRAEAHLARRKGLPVGDTAA